MSPRSPLTLLRYVARALLEAATDAVADLADDLVLAGETNGGF
jgi:hypothetical protein